MRAAVEEVGPAFVDAAELGFDLGDELGFEGVAVGAEVGGVYGVGVVIEGVGVLELDDEDAGEVGRGPLLVLVVGLLLLDAVVAGEVEALGVVGLEVGVGRGRAEVGDIGDEVIVEYGVGVVGGRVLVKALRDEDDGGDEHGAAPEFGEERGLDADVADVFGVGLRGDGGDDFV